MCFPPKTQAFCPRGGMQGTGLAAAGSLPAGRSARSSRGTGRHGLEPARRRLPGLDLSLPLVGKREDVAAPREPGPGRGTPSSLRDKNARGCVTPGARVIAVGSCALRSVSPRQGRVPREVTRCALQLFPRDSPEGCREQGASGGWIFLGMRLRSPEQR